MGSLILRVKVLLRKELIQAMRDPRLRLLIFLPPLVQLVAFGYAANLDLKNIPVGLYDEDHSPLSRELTAAFTSSGYFRIVGIVSRPNEMTRLIDKGAAKAVFHFGPTFSSRIGGGRTAFVQVIVAGTDSNTASLVQNYATRIIDRFNRTKLDMRLDRNPSLRMILPAGSKGIVEPEIRVWFNTGLESRNFYVPGIIALVIMVSTLNLTAMSVVREKEIGTLEQIMVTPIRPIEFILGKTVPFAFIGIFQVALITSVGVFWFGVPMRGSLLLLFGCLLIYLLCTLSMGLFISTISRNQQQALVTIFFFTFPIILLSGFIFPIANMPKIIQFFTYINPLRYFLIIIRYIFLKGAGLDTLWPQIFPLFVISLGLMLLAVRRVRKTLG
jgi:ABC-2 type transport system permease protein